MLNSSSDYLLHYCHAFHYYLIFANSAISVIHCLVPTERSTGASLVTTSSCIFNRSSSCLGVILDNTPQWSTFYGKGLLFSGQRRTQRWKYCRKATLLRYTTHHALMNGHLSWHSDPYTTSNGCFFPTFVESNPVFHTLKPSWQQEECERAERCPCPCTRYGLQAGTFQDPIFSGLTSIFH